MTEAFVENRNEIIKLNNKFNYHKLHLGDYIIIRDEKDEDKITSYKLICFIHLPGTGVLPVVNEITFGGFVEHNENYMKYIKNLK